MAGTDQTQAACSASGCCLSAPEKQSETLQGSPSFQTGGQDLEQAVQTGTLALGRGCREPASLGGARRRRETQRMQPRWERAVLCQRI